MSAGPDRDLRGTGEGSRATGSPNTVPPSSGWRQLTTRTDSDTLRWVAGICGDGVRASSTRTTVQPTLLAASTTWSAMVLIGPNIAPTNMRSLPMVR